MNTVKQTVVQYSDLWNEIQLAKIELLAENNTCVLVKGGKVIHKAAGIGVSPLLRLYETQEGRTKMEKAIVADTIIGKGAAVLLVLGKISAIHGQVMSRSACEYLNTHKIPFTYSTLVEYIENRNKNGLCPIEKSVLNIDNPEKAYEKIKETIAILMANK